MPIATDPIARVVLGLALILVAARLGAWLLSRIGQPAVLGELLAGVLLGNLGLFASLKNDPMLDLLAGIGALILLFEVGLESSLAQMLKVGRSALLVAAVGVAASLLLGLGVCRALLPEARAT